jgi:hypothetical protein
VSDGGWITGRLRDIPSRAESPDELGEGEQQEELYLVVEGRARFVCDGEAVELGPGELLFARPGVRREAVALETPTMLFMVGGRPGEPYSPPIWASDWRGAR